MNGVAKCRKCSDPLEFTTDVIGRVMERCRRCDSRPRAQAADPAATSLELVRTGEPTKGPKTCADCGAGHARRSEYCEVCGEKRRIANKRAAAKADYERRRAAIGATVVPRPRVAVPVAAADAPSPVAAATGPQLPVQPVEPTPAAAGGAPDYAAVLAELEAERASIDVAIRVVRERVQRAAGGAS